MAIFQLLTSKNKPLLVRWDTLLILNLGFYIVDRIGSFDVKSYRFAGECLDKDLHATPETKDKMQSGFFLDIVIRQCTAIFQLLTSKNKPLLVRWDTLLILNLGFYIVNRIGSFDVKSY